MKIFHKMFKIGNLFIIFLYLYCDYISLSLDMISSKTCAVFSSCRKVSWTSTPFYSIYIGVSVLVFRNSILQSVGSKIIRALAIILAICPWFDLQFLSSHACYKQQKALRSWLDKNLFHKMYSVRVFWHEISQVLE